MCNLIPDRSFKGAEGKRLRGEEGGEAASQAIIITYERRINKKEADLLVNCSSVTERTLKDEPFSAS